MSGYCHSQVPLPQPDEFMEPHSRDDEPVAEIPCAALAEAKGHLRVALVQSAPPGPWGDDAIIIGHIRDALALLEGTR